MGANTRTLNGSTKSSSGVVTSAGLTLSPKPHDPVGATPVCYEGVPGKIPLMLGINAKGGDVTEDLSRLHHILIGSSDEREKTRVLRTIIASLVLHVEPGHLRLMIVCSGKTALDACDALPHLLHPVINELAEAVRALEYLMTEMRSRFEYLTRSGADHLQPSSSFPAIVVIISELADLRCSDREDVKESIACLARFGHDVGIHLILATSQLTRSVVPTSIRANIPARIALRVKSQAESRIIIDLPGAESLAGQGDALLTHTETSKTSRLQVFEINDAGFQAVIDGAVDAGDAGDAGDAVLGFAF